MSKAGKKKDSNNKINSGSIAGDAAQATVGAYIDSKARAKTYPVWPEFVENDVASEKWDAPTKGKEKGKSAGPSSFEDPEGKIELPSNLKVHEWKRPVDFLDGKTPVVVNEGEVNFDIIKPNEHLFHSELMRCIIGQFCSLWNMSSHKPKPTIPPSTKHGHFVASEPGEENQWRPWEHIYTLWKPSRMPNVPQYNPYGKYVIKLFWMGCWRKIIVDDFMPFDAEGKLLLPAAKQDYKLWPLLLSKALVKIASIDYGANDTDSELGDFFVLHCLTGWLPETIPLEGLFTQYVLHKRSLMKRLKGPRLTTDGGYKSGQEDVGNTPQVSGQERYGRLQHVWNLLKDILPEWRRPNEKEDIESDTALTPASFKKDKLETGAVKGDAGGGSKGARGGKDVGKKKDDRDKKAVNEPESTEKVEKRPETVIFATYVLPDKSSARVSVLKDMADSRRQLRKAGLSCLHPHPVQLTRTRNIPLKPPPPPPVIPRWKLVRPAKKAAPLLDAPICPEPPKPDQWLEISSVFVNHRSFDHLSWDPSLAKSRTSPQKKRSRPSTGVSKGGVYDTEQERKENTVFQSNPSKRRMSIRSLGGSRVKDYKHSMRIPKDNDDLWSEAENELQLDDNRETKLCEAVAEAFSKTSWMDFEDFCRSFHTLIIFHKPASYAYQRSLTEIKHLLSTGSPCGGTSNKKGSAVINQSGSSNSLILSTILKEEERIPSYLFVDNVDPTVLIVSFSVLSKWGGNSENDREKKASDKESLAGTWEEVGSGAGENGSPPTGLLIGEPFSWKSIPARQPILRIKTSGTRAVCMTLPAGRHVLRLFFDTPLGYSLTICSVVNFVLGSEEIVMKPLVEESCRFTRTATSIMQGIGKCIEALGDAEAFRKARIALHACHMPYKVAHKKELAKHYEIWHRAFYETLNHLPTESRSPALGFALRAFNLDLSRQSSESPTVLKGSAEAWINCTPDGLKAICRIQNYWRGALARKMRRAVMQKGTSEHSAVKDALNNMWQYIQPNLEATGLKLFRSMLKQDPTLIEKYSFFNDEWYKIVYTDYVGTFEDQPANTWFVMFREVFTVEEDTFCVPKLYSPVRASTLRVTDNDTGKEITRVFQKVAPYTYRKNKNGYTFLCEARSSDIPLSGDSWSLRLIGSANPLPQPISGQVSHQFRTKEKTGFYVPNENNLIFRYHVKTKSDLIASLQLKTSKPDVYVKLQILENDVEIVSVQGRGHCVIPAFDFLTDDKPDIRPGSISKFLLPAYQDSKSHLNQPSKQGASDKKRPASTRTREGKTSPKRGSRDLADSRINWLKQDAHSPSVDYTDLAMVNKYRIQAVVERDSWPLNEAQWAFVGKLREQEKEEIKVYSGHGFYKAAKHGRPGSRGASKGGGKMSILPDKGKKGGKADKGGKEKKIHDKEPGSRPPSQKGFDASKPCWVLNVVVDEEKADDIDVEKDTDRQQEIRAEKRAWEAHEPGRAVKAHQARLAYLERYTKKVEKDSDKENEDECSKSEEVSDAGAAEALTLGPPRPLTPKVILEPLDLSPFRRPQSGEEAQFQYLDDDILALKEMTNAEVAVEYERQRREVLEWREKEKSDRLHLKIGQIRAFQEMQNKLDCVRAKLRKPREEYRQSLLEDQRRREEEEEKAAAAALAAAAEAGPRSPSPKGKKSSSKKKK